jgi:hypothetical protein
VNATLIKYPNTPAKGNSAILIGVVKLLFPLLLVCLAPFFGVCLASAAACARHYRGRSFPLARFSSSSSSPFPFAWNSRGGIALLPANFAFFMRVCGKSDRRPRTNKWLINTTAEQWQCG